MVCGDGICDGGDTCSTCYLDCGSCGYKPCPTNSKSNQECSGRGKCDKGVCICNSGWSSSNCDLSSGKLYIYILL